MSKPGNLWRKIHGRITKKPTNFSWFIDNKLAGSGMPTSSEEFDWVIKQGVKSIVTMTEDALPQPWTQSIQYLHVPTEDLTAPDIEKIDQTVDFIHERIKNKEPTMVHCAGGLGRTGVILACYLIKYENYSANDAIEGVRKERPGSIQSELQQIVISLYEKHVRK
ncbi:MAG: dual specificity protein phosphatase 23 [Nitrosopumilaceae archaeon]